MTDTNQTNTIQTDLYRNSACCRQSILSPLSTIQTDVYRNSASSYGRLVAGRVASQWWWALALPVAVLLVAGLADWRWGIGALALVLICYPGLLMIGYYAYCLTPEAVRVILPQSVQFDHNGFVVTYYPVDEEARAPRPERYEYADVTDYTDQSGRLIIEAKMQTMIIPDSAWHDISDKKQIISNFPLKKATELK